MFVPPSQNFHLITSVSFRSQDLWMLRSIPNPAEQDAFTYKGKGKGFNLYSASPIHASSALFVTNQSRRPNSHRV